ncbi:MAG TPA: acylphosphatase [Devosia sp.]
MPRRLEYSSDVEGGSPVRVRWDISGRMNVPTYLDFVVERAQWLGLDGWVAANDDDTVSLAVAGPEALVGALEMACTLGPLDALIDEVRPVGEPDKLPAGFSVRQK